MTSRLVYLAGPQDDVTSEEARHWRAEIAKRLPAHVACFSPAHAYLGVGASSFPVVDAANRTMITYCDLMIAWLAGEGRGFGTIREIEFAVAMDKPVIVVGPAIRLSLMSHDVTVVDTMDDAVEALYQRHGWAKPDKRDDRV